MKQFAYLKFFILLHRYECLTVKYATSRFQMKLHPGYEWHIFHILTSEDSLTSFLCFSFVFRLIFFLFSKHSYPCNKNKITRCLEHMKFTFSRKKGPLKDKLHMFAPPCNILYAVSASLKTLGLGAIKNCMTRSVPRRSLELEVWRKRIAPIASCCIQKHTSTLTKMHSKVPFDFDWFLF